MRGAEAGDDDDDAATATLNTSTGYAARLRSNNRETRRLGFERRNASFQLRCTRDANAGAAIDERGSAEEFRRETDKECLMFSPGLPDLISVF